MAKLHKISPETCDKLDDIDKFIFKLANVRSVTPKHTKQKIKNTIDYIFTKKI